jgi:hypothetical protein
MHAQDSTSVRRQVLIPGSRERARAQRMLDALLAEAEAVVHEDALGGPIDTESLIDHFREIVSHRAVGVVCAALEAQPQPRVVEVEMWPAKVGA